MNEHKVGNYKPAIKIRHARLNLFYESTLLNFCLIGLCLSMTLAGFDQDSYLPLICMGIFAVVFIPYSLWFWIGKAKTIATDHFLSEISGIYLIYCLIAGTINNPSHWWRDFAVIAAITILLVYCLRLDRARRAENTGR